MSLKEPRRVHIRWMIPADPPALALIDEDAFANSWKAADIKAALRPRSVWGMVGEIGDTPVSYMLYGLNPNHFQIIRMAVDVKYRRQGIGYQMIQKLIGKLAPNRKVAIAINVRERNLTAQKFFRTCRFKATGVQREFFKDTGEDAYHMIYWMDGADHRIPLLPNEKLERSIEIEGYVSTQMV